MSNSEGITQKEIDAETRSLAEYVDAIITEKITQSNITQSNLTKSNN